MKDITKYQGVIPAFYACYDEKGEISTEGVKALTRHLISKGVKGVYVGGSSGECIYQHVDERKKVLEAVMEEAKGKRIFLMGGGIGIPPMVQTAKEAEAEITVIAGYRNSEIFLKEELEKAGKLVVATEDGSVGTKGNVMDAIRENNLEADVIFACGPTPMLRAIKKYAEEKNILCYLSMEEKMAFGIGACLACVCKSKEKDSHSHVHNKRVCKDGPVFLSTEVEL